MYVITHISVFQSNNVMFMPINLLCFQPSFSITIPFSITQIVQDHVCVVNKSDNSSCINQDVLFLGLGKATHFMFCYSADI